MEIALKWGTRFKSLVCRREQMANGGKLRVTRFRREASPIWPFLAENICEWKTKMGAVWAVIDI